MKRILVCALLALTACDNPATVKERQENSARQYEQSYQAGIDKESELKGCIIRLVRQEGNSSNSIVVVRCPNSSVATDYSSGKFHRETFTTDSAGERG